MDSATLRRLVGSATDLGDLLIRTQAVKQFIPTDSNVDVIYNNLRWLNGDDTATTSDGLAKVAKGEVGVLDWLNVVERTLGLAATRYLASKMQEMIHPASFVPIVNPRPPREVLPLSPRGVRSSITERPSLLLTGSPLPLGQKIVPRLEPM